MRVLQVITDTDRRGAQLFAIALGEQLRRLGHEVCTVALAPGGLSDPLEVEVLGPRARGIRSLRRLRQLGQGADVTIAHGSSTAAACALARIPFVYRQIGDTRYWARGPFRRIRVSGYLRCARRVVALADSARDDLKGHLWLGARQVDVVPNGVDGRVFRPPTPEERTYARSRFRFDSGDLVVLCVSGLDPAKGVDHAISAVAKLPGVRLLVVGDGPLRSELEEYASAVCPQRVTFAGQLVDPTPAYHAADLLLMPSQGADSMPAVLIEAGLSGLAAVTTDVGASAEVVKDGLTGTVVARGSVPAIAGAIRAYLADESSRQRAGQDALVDYTARFEIREVALRWQQVLTSCLSTARRT